MSRDIRIRRIACMGDIHIRKHRSVPNAGATIDVRTFVLSDMILITNIVCSKIITNISLNYDFL